MQVSIAEGAIIFWKKENKSNSPSHICSPTNQGN
jgi:hypothetical protein